MNKISSLRHFAVSGRGVDPLPTGQSVRVSDGDRIMRTSLIAALAATGLLASPALAATTTKSPHKVAAGKTVKSTHKLAAATTKTAKKK